MITINLIHYNSNELLIKAIQSVLEFSGIPKDDLYFIVTDNSQNLQKSQLEALEINFLYYNPGYNSGFARGVNYGIRNAKGEFILLMNQDACLTEPETLSKLFKKHKHLPAKTILSCEIFGEDRNRQQSIWLDEPGFKREWRFSAFNTYFNKGWQSRWNEQVNKIHEQSGFVNRINGAFLLIPLAILKNKEEILFDEDFFLYGEDVEWAMRIKKSGWLFYYDKSIRIMHIGSYSSKENLNKSKQLMLSSWLVVRKRKGIIYFILYIIFVWANKKLDHFMDKRKNVGSSIVKQNLDIVQSLYRNYFRNIILIKRRPNDFIANCYY
jgi:N-acetylglucosaminyl-diphospho-decaprenol L-rhamnosyltransferase